MKLKYNKRKYFNKEIVGNYTTTHPLYMRSGPDKEYDPITVISKGEKVICKGFYVKDWYYVKYNENEGYCMKDYLER